MSDDSILMHVYRFNPERDREGRLESFRVPYEPGMSVLDGLKEIRNLHDSTLAFLHSCRHCHSCKMCAALINGRPGYLCTTRITNEVTVEPLPNKPVIRDLVVDLGWAT